MDREISANGVAVSQILSDNYSGLKMVAQQTADFDRTKAMEVMESLLLAHPQIDAVFCGNDAMAMGAYRALVTAGKDKQGMVFGFDGARDAIDEIRAGHIVATGMQFPRTMAQMAAEGVTKRFGGVKALDGAHLEVYAGQTYCPGPGQENVPGWYHAWNRAVRQLL